MTIEKLEYAKSLEHNIKELSAACSILNEANEYDEISLLWFGKVCDISCTKEELHKLFTQKINELQGKFDKL